VNQDVPKCDRPSERKGVKRTKENAEVVGKFCNGKRTTGKSSKQQGKKNDTEKANCHLCRGHHGGDGTNSSSEFYVGSAR
jgi:hypothetical protein